MNVAVTGENGRLGSELLSWGCVPLGCADISNKAELERCLERVCPNIVINCAADTHVDQAEDIEYFRSHVSPANVVGVMNLANLCEQSKTKLIQISTDYIFGGKFGPYAETQVFPEETDIPKGNYAISKCAAEAVLMAYSNYVIVRTTGLYGKLGNDFVGMILDKLKHKEEVKVTKNLHGNQTYIPHLAQALMALVQCPVQTGHHIHIASKDILTRYEFALMIANVFGYDPSLIIPTNSNKVPGWVAPRPVHGGLKIERALDLKLPIYTIAEGLKALKDEA